MDEKKRSKRHSIRIGVLKTLGPLDSFGLSVCAGGRTGWTGSISGRMKSFQDNSFREFQEVWRCCKCEIDAFLKSSSLLRRMVQTDCLVMINKEWFKTIVNFMSPGAGFLVLGRGYTSHIVKMHYFFLNLFLYSQHRSEKLNIQ